MSKHVDCTAHTAPAIMLIEAMTRESKRDDLLEKFNVPKIPLRNHAVEVKLTINGVEVDYLKTAQEMWDRMAARFDEDVLAKAKELLSRTRFERLEEILTRAEDEIEREVEALMQEEKHEQRTAKS